MSTNSLVGQSIGGRYHIVEQLGKGGMAVVYKAFDTRLEREVAIKLIRMESFGAEVAEQMLKRFEREGKSLAKMMHPNIVPIHDYGEYNGSPYLVMAYIPGGTLKGLLGRAMPYAQAARLIAPVARALAYAHGMNIIHRDVKPANILITSSGQPMLSDFGVAKILESEEGNTLTGTGVGIGTPEYMAPEQWINKVVPQTDIYALGVIFYELLTGYKPYTADTPAAILIKQTNDPLPRPKQFVSSLPDQVEQVIYKAMAKKPEERYANVADFAAALEKLAAQPEADLRDASTIVKPMRDEATVKFPQQVTDASVDKAKPASQRAPGAGAIPTWAYLLGGVIIVGIMATVLGFGIWMLSGGFGLKKTPTQMAAALPMETTAVAATAIPTSVQETVPEMTETPLPPTQTVTVPPQVKAIETQVWQDGMVGVYVPAGEFEMGSEAPKEKPAHTVYLDAFWIDQTEVTNAMYAKCVQAGACKVPALDRSKTRVSYYGDSQYMDYPVNEMDWYRADAYCAWAGRRLPTEAEWEKASRGTDGRSYPWGEQEPSCDLLNYNDCIGETSAVGSYPGGASPYGALDMAGNVYEWVADWYGEDYYSQSPGSNPLGPSSGEERLVRGGVFSESEFSSRSSYRYWTEPDSFSYIFGFRCARSQD